MRRVLVKGPGIDIAFGRLKRLPLNRENLAQNLAERLALLASGRINRDQRPIHRSLREVTTEITRNPKLCAVPVDRAVTAVVDLVGVAELAEMLLLSVFVVRSRMPTEVADAEVWTAAGLDCGRVDCPFIGGHGRVPGDNPAQASMLTSASRRIGSCLPSGWNSMPIASGRNDISLQFPLPSPWLDRELAGRGNHPVMKRRGTSVTVNCTLST